MGLLFTDWGNTSVHKCAEWCFETQEVRLAGMEPFIVRIPSLRLSQRGRRAGAKVAVG